MNENSPWPVDLVATLDGRVAELGRRFSDEELERAEALISLCAELAPLQQHTHPSMLRVEFTDQVARARILAPAILCLDLSQKGAARARLIQRARAAVEKLNSFGEGRR